jgi:signal transduction histidine kinase
MILVIADDPGFSRDLLARWQMERVVPGFTVMSTGHFNGAATGQFDLVILGPARDGRMSAILKGLDTISHPVICVLESAAQIQAVKSEYPRVLGLHRHEQWVDSLLLVASECLKRVDLTARVRKAEQAVAVHARNAALGRYMLETRHDFNNMLTSVLGNSELLLMDSSAFPETARDQLETIHTMALHIHEIMQRFSSIAIEMQVAEKQSQGETVKLSHVPPSASQAVSQKS